MQGTQETWVRSLCLEDPIEKKMATHSNIFAWRIPWTEESSGLQSMGLKESDMTEQEKKLQIKYILVKFENTPFYCMSFHVADLIILFCSKTLFKIYSASFPCFPLILYFLVSLSRGRIIRSKVMNKAK